MSYVVMFPGQGSQRQGMLSDAYNYFPCVRDAFCEASDVLSYNLWDVIVNDADRLNESEVTQPAILASSVGLWRALEQLTDMPPSTMLGHSLGEYSALVCSGSIPFDQALRLVALRGQLMQGCSDDSSGMMVAVLGLSRDQVAALCEACADGQVLVLANINSPAQMVVSGERAACERLMSQAKEAGARRVLALPVSVAAHSPLMMPMRLQFQAALDAVDISMPRIRVYQNATLEPPADVPSLKEALLNQLTGPVDWVHMMNQCHSDGGVTFIECGPERVLSQLNKRINSLLDNHPVASPNDLRKACEVVSIKQ